MEKLEIMTLQEAAEKLGVPRRRLDGWRRNGVKGVKLSVVRIGGRVGVTEEMLNRFLVESHQKKAPNEFPFAVQIALLKIKHNFQPHPFSENRSRCGRKRTLTRMG